jgi:cytochrome c5
MLALLLSKKNKRIKMKRILSVSALSLFVLLFGSCSPKVTPTKTTVETKETKVETKETTADKNYTVVLNSMYGKETFEAKCGSCHNLNKPSDYTFKEWNPILDRMAKKADLDYLQKQNVLGYLKDNAKAEK